MAQVIVLSVVLVISLLILNSFLNHICGVDSSGNYGKVLEGTVTIAVLYFVIISLLGNRLMPDGIPFIDQLDGTLSLTSMFKNRPFVFVLECAKLISLTFVISLVSSFISSNLGGTGITGTIIRNIVLVLVGIIANNYFLSIIKKTIFFSWALSALQCFFSGTALVITPAMVISNLLQLDPQSKMISFLVKELPQTKIGKAMSTAASNSIVLVFVIMIFESQYGSVGNFLFQVPTLISLFAPLVILIIGIRLIIKSIK